ncbi:MAG: right-handed parallel beta-helix repeat-containing protein [Candidatus Aenigmatarchaeota archaeon]
MRKSIFAIPLLVLIVLASGCVGQETTTTPTVITGKTVISDSGTYILDSDISCIVDSEGACIAMQGRDIVLDCQGHSITRTITDARKKAGSAGIVVAGGGVGKESTKNTVRNCRIEKFAMGIFLKTAHSNFTNNTINDNNIGIYYDDYSSYNNFVNNTVSDNNKGIDIFMRSFNNTFTGNTVRNNGIYGISITCAAHHNTFSDNVIEGNGYGSASEEHGGVYILNSYANVFSGNIICNNSETIVCKFDAAMEGINDVCRPQGDIHFVQVDTNAQEAGTLIDGGENTCGLGSMSCDGATIGCVACP